MRRTLFFVVELLPRLRVRVGITAGRLILLWLNKKIGERTALFLYAILCIGYVSSAPSVIMRPFFLYHRDLHYPYAASHVAYNSPLLTSIQPRNHRLDRTQPHRKCCCDFVRWRPHGPNVPHPRQPGKGSHSALATQWLDRLDCGCRSVWKCYHTVGHGCVVCEVRD